MDGDGKLYCDFLTTKSRYGILNTWLNEVDSNGNLHGDCMLIGTPSMRARHSIIVNVPSAEAAWGPEMRALFITEPGWKIIGADSSGNQARGLAHYLKSEEFTHTLLNGDIHTFNAKAINSVLINMGINWSEYLVKSGVKADESHTLEVAIAKAMRARAKRILYAFLFGASGGKLWSYLFDKIDETRGKKFKLGFTKAVPGFAVLLDKLESIYGKTKQYGDGYIPCIAGNRIYCDSFHKLLVYLLQSLEKVTCASALMLTMENLEKENIPYKPYIFYHDEIDFAVPEEYVERAAAISKASFRDGPKLFGVTIMDGEAKIGNNWFEVH
jgi:DNA polymerase I-like protein with 3'-5' exonuclease and polymerase domains